jgi:hypothetical protein
VIDPSHLFLIVRLGSCSYSTQIQMTPSHSVGAAVDVMSGETGERGERLLRFSFFSSFKHSFHCSPRKWLRFTIRVILLGSAQSGYSTGRC